MATTTALFKARFTEFASIADARIQLFLDDAELAMDEAIWDVYFDVGQSYLAAHYLALAEKSAVGSSVGTSGPVVGRTVDGVSISYGSGAPSPNQNAAYFQTTQYGQRYLVLMKNLGTRMSLV